MATDAPTGIVTLMFTDIQGSTQLWEKMDERFRPVMDRHNELIRGQAERWEGFEVKNLGDSFMLAFHRACDALQCAVEIQREVAEEEWPPQVAAISGSALRVRIGLHTGEPFLGYSADGRPDYFGTAVNRASRISDAAHGGQTLISSATREVVSGSLTRDLELVDLKRHRLKGLEYPEQIFEVRHPSLPPEAFPPLRNVAGMRGNLPEALTSFVGRIRELDELSDLIARPATRLITITGSGGSGKSRLAHQIATRCGAAFDDGVWHLDLSEIAQPDQLIAGIAGVLQIAVGPDRQPLDQLISYLKERRLLLVLDSFERVVPAARLLSEVIRAAPNVKCLVTSQVGLGLQFELVFPLQPMPLPGRNQIAPLDLAGCESVQLFLERARHARHDLVVDESSAPLIASLCRRLDGLPLALELAAAQCADLSLEEILAGLKSQFDLLLNDSPDLPERHRTLQAAIEWSYQLLPESERRSLCQLSVFSGGWLMESAQAVLGPSIAPSTRNLRRHSLIKREEAAGRTRYVLFQTIRDFLLRRLEGEAEHAQIARNHAEHYLSLAESRVRCLRTLAEAQALEELDAEFDNLRAALSWAQRNREGELGARLALALYEGLYRRGFWEEANSTLGVGREALEIWAQKEADRATESGAGKAIRADLAHHQASLDLDRGNLIGCRRWAEISLALRDELGDRRGVAESLNLLGLIDLQEKDHATARARFEEALNRTDPEDDAGRGRRLHNLGLLAMRMGDMEGASSSLEEALRLRRAAGDARGEAETLGNLGVLFYESGDLARARLYYRQSLEISAALRDRQVTAIMLNNLAEIAEAEERWTQAIALFAHSRAIFRDLGSVHVHSPHGSLDRLRQKDLGLNVEETIREALKRSWEDQLTG